MGGGLFARIIIMSNNRIFWAVEGVGIAPESSTSYVVARGVQSVGLNTTFNVEDAFELGQLEVYEQSEDIPDIEVTLEKYIDGYPLLYHLATRGYTSNTLSGRLDKRCNLALAIFGDDRSEASGVPESQVTCSGLYTSNWGLTCPVDGFVSESLTLVGNDKVWKTSSFDLSGTLIDPNTPLALDSGLGGLQRRENIVFDLAGAVAVDVNGQVNTTDATILPPDIQGVSSSGTNFANSVGVHPAHIQSISINASLTRENANELGKRTPYFRYPAWPLEVTCDVEVISTVGDNVNAREDTENLTNRSIKVKLEEGTFVDLGTKNKLTGVTHGGGDTGGGNVAVTYSYRTLNYLVVTHPQDPT